METCQLCHQFYAYLYDEIFIVNHNEQQRFRGILTAIDQVIALYWIYLKLSNVYNSDIKDVDGFVA